MIGDHILVVKQVFISLFFFFFEQRFAESGSDFKINRCGFGTRSLS